MTDKAQFRPLAEIDVLILCGGLGSRLRPIITECQKVLAPIGGKPFLEILVEDLVQQGFRRVIFCVGHLKEQIIERFSDRGGAEYLFSQENVPLGTGGAIQNALLLIQSNPFLIVNGDSLCQVKFENVLQFHLDRSAAATLVLTAANGRDDGGTVLLDKACQIQSFAEKSAGHEREGFINAGIYLLRSDAVEWERLVAPFSLEFNILPALVTEKRCFGFVVDSPLIDIGTPERYQKANKGQPQ